MTHHSFSSLCHALPNTYHNRSFRKNQLKLLNPSLLTFQWELIYQITRLAQRPVRITRYVTSPNSANTVLRQSLSSSSSSSLLACSFAFLPFRHFCHYLCRMAVVSVLLPRFIYCNCKHVLSYFFIFIYSQQNSLTVSCYVFTFSFTRFYCTTKF